MTEKIRRELVRRAIENREKAYVPYSQFSVGAALLTQDGLIYDGCNLENSSFPAGMCAERTAFFSALAAGERKFEAIALSGGMEGLAPRDYCIPCGMCLQVMSEFCPPSFPILVAKNEEDVKEFRMEELLPYVFTSLK